MKSMQGMQPDAAASLKAAFAELKSSGIPVSLNSGYRDPAEQKALYARYLAGKNPYPVAPPGHSNHEKGIAADLGIDPEHRDNANAILAQHGWQWHGPSDAVHYDYKGTPASNATQTAAQIQAIVNRPLSIPNYSDPASQAQMDASLANVQGLAQNGVTPVAPTYGSGAQPSPAGSMPLPSDPISAPPSATDNAPWWRKALDYGEDYLYNTVGNSGNDLGQRLNYAIKPLSDAANALTYGAVGNVLQHTFSPLRAGLLQGVAQERIGLGQEDPTAAFGPAGLSAEWQSMVKAWNGQQDPTLPRGIGNAVAGFDNPLTQAIDFAGDWYAGGKFAHTFFSPLIRGAATATGVGVGEALSNAADNGTVAARPLAALVQRGIGGNIRPALDAGNAALWNKFGDTTLGRQILPTLQSLTASGADLRAGVESYTRNTAMLRTLGNDQARIYQMIGDETKKLGGDAIGNSLDGTHWMVEHPDLEGHLDGNMIGQLVNHYAEAGSPSAGFGSPAEVLQQAERLFPNNPDLPQVIQKIGKEARALDMHVGEQSVASGLMDPATFAENAGMHVRHSYQLNQLTKDQASALSEDMANRGYANTPTFAMVQNVAENGGAGQAGRLVGGGGMRNVIQQRTLLDFESRLKHLPDFDYTHSAKQGLQYQLQAAAQANILKDVADPALGMSLANKIASETHLHPPVTEQPVLQGEAARNAKEFASLQNQFTKKGGVDETQNALAGTLNKQIADAEGARQAAVAHYASEPQEPPMPGLRASIEPTLKSGTPLTGSGKLSVAAGARGAEAISQLKNSADLDQYAKDLSAHNRAHSQWAKKLADLNDTVSKANDKARSLQAAHAAHLRLIDALNERAEQLNRRNELLSGNRTATDDDAADALAKAIKKVDPSGETAAAMTPDVQRGLMDTWLKHWNDHNSDIFSDIPKGGLPRAPVGLPQDVIDAMGENNPLIPMALGKGLSAGDREIQASEAARLGWTRFGEDYGPMSGRWGSVALKAFLDDAMDPNRFIGAKSDIGGAVKFLGEMQRSLKLYMNPISRMNVVVQSIFDNMATAAEAGKVYNPLSDKLGRGEWSAWLHGGPETATVKALRQFGNEMQGGPRQSVDPGLAYAKDPLGELGKNPVVQALRSFKEGARQNFVLAQVLPKAGLVRNLMDQGMDPASAAKWAEIAHGGAGTEMGGVETPGVLHLAEMLNRNGVAMFTSYPLHSITRILQLMQNNPQVAMTYPLLRNYLIGASSPEVQRQAHDKAFDYSSIPLPLNNPIGRFFANPDGSQAVMNVSNAIPYGGAFGDMTGFPSLYGYLHPGEKQIEGIDRSGLNPIDTASAEAGARVKGLTGAFFPAAQRIYNATQGMLPQAGATKTQSPQQAISALFGLPFHNPEDAMTRAFDVSKTKPIGGRMDFLAELQDRYMNGKDSGEPDLTRNVTLSRMDPEKLSAAIDAAVNKSVEITTDRSLNEKQAHSMLRNQAGYIHSLMYLYNKSTPRAEAYQQSQGIFQTPSGGM